MHTPVLLAETIKYLDPSPAKKYLDCTLGYAGHTLELLKAGATVVGIDQDADMLELATTRIVEAGYSASFTAIRSSFASALTGARLENNSFDGILFDLGVSSYQLDTKNRGFSFQSAAPLDMRMNKDLSVTAKDLVNGLGKNELVELFTTLGEERFTKQIVHAIVEKRKLKPITTTVELATLIESVVAKSAKSKSRIHPATRVFQALRMAVNSEREELKAALPSALSKLVPNGVLAVITFHSLEDTIVTDFFTSNQKGLTLLTSNPIVPSSQEILKNPRSRSAKLYVGRAI